MLQQTGGFEGRAI